VKAQDLASYARAAIALAVAAISSGCIGNIRETTTPRTSTEMLLVSTAAERAVKEYEYPADLKGKRVAIDDTKFDSVDKNYLVSALRNYVAENGSSIVPVAPVKTKDPAGKEVEVGPERIVEIRNGALGLDDRSLGIGIPPLPVPVPNTNMVAGPMPGLWIFWRGKQEGWAKFQLWVLDPKQSAYISKSTDLWGHTYYSKWTLFGIGPFDWSNDIYPDTSLLSQVK
jgi:hypothetical protein